MKQTNSMMVLTRKQHEDLQKMLESNDDNKVSAIKQFCKWIANDSTDTQDNSTHSVHFEHITKLSIPEFVQALYEGYEVELTLEEKIEMQLQKAKQKLHKCFITHNEYVAFVCGMQTASRLFYYNSETISHELIKWEDSIFFDTTTLEERYQVNINHP